MNNYLLYFFYFVIYALLGWAYESVVVSIRNKKITSTGFLYGPCCPIYAFVSVGIILLINPLSENAFIIFFAGMFITTIVEYVTSFILETIFHSRWWNYERFPLNIQGRIAPIPAIVFGLFSVLLIKVLHPTVASYVDMLPSWVYTPLATFMIIAIATDLYFTVNRLLKENNRGEEIKANIGLFITNIFEPFTKLAKENTLSKNDINQGNVFSAWHRLKKRLFNASDN